MSETDMKKWRSSPEGAVKACYEHDTDRLVDLGENIWKENYGGVLSKLGSSIL